MGTIAIDTLSTKVTEILGSTRPLKLDALRYLAQRWDSPRQVLQVGAAAQRTGSQPLTFRVPLGSCIESSSALGGYATLVATAVQVLFYLKQIVSKF
ncbi:MAG: hypothetical protein V7K27_18940 [Nostoc sp.]